jgi:hypothetical protein
MAEKISNHWTQNIQTHRCQRESPNPGSEHRQPVLHTTSLHPSRLLLYHLELLLSLFGTSATTPCRVYHHPSYRYGGQGTPRQVADILTVQRGLRAFLISHLVRRTCLICSAHCHGVMNTAQSWNPKGAALPLPLALGLFTKELLFFTQRHTHRASRSRKKQKKRRVVKLVSVQRLITLNYVFFLTTLYCGVFRKAGRDGIRTWRNGRERTYNSGFLHRQVLGLCYFQVER